ncbi:MAG: hypothetical protein MMC33_009927 [Icmadophila ericetorum]|nr:hypothetical protein [Icmadophila ericetorum]
MAQRDFNKAESELDRYMAPLSKLAKRLSTTEGATGEEVDDMMTDYEKMLKELGPNLVRHQGCYNRPRWTTELQNLENLRTLLLTHVDTISLLLSKATSLSHGFHVSSDDEIGSDSDLDIKNKLVIQELESAQRQSSLGIPTVNKRVDSLRARASPQRFSSPSRLNSPSTDTVASVVSSRYQDSSQVGSSTPATSYSIRSSVSATQREAFERELRRNAVVLYEEKAICVKYAGWNERRQDWIMVRATSDCRILLIRKLDPSSPRAPRFATTIWILSDDGSAHVEQSFDDDTEIMPYTSWGDTLNVSLKLESRLRFHHLAAVTGKTETIRTSGMGYMFDNEAASTNFQSALAEKTLILSVRTTKTTRLHEGVAGFVATQDLLCGLENLRLWKDQGTGMVIATIHYKSNLRDGYLTFEGTTPGLSERPSPYLCFPVNSEQRPLKVKEEGSRSVKLKGQGLPPYNKGKKNSPELSAQGSPPRHETAEKKKGGVRIEFETAEERNEFSRVCREVQLPLVP